MRRLIEPGLPFREQRTEAVLKFSASRLRNPVAPLTVNPVQTCHAEGNERSRFPGVDCHIAEPMIWR